MADQEKIDQDVATSSSSPPPSTPPPAAHSAPSAAPLASSSPSLFVPPPSGSSLPAYPAAPPASAHSVYFAPLPPAYPVPHPHPHAHPHAVQYQPPVMLASPHHAAPPQQPWGYGPQGPPPAAHAQPPLPGHGYAVSPFARPPMHHMPHSHPYPHAAYHVAGPRHSVPTESWGYPAGAAAYAYDHEHQHTQHHPHHPHAAMGSAGPRAMDSSPNQQHTALTKASKKRSRSPSNDKAPAKRPAGLEKRNSSSAGTAKVVERDGQTTTVFQCRGFGDCCMTFTRSEHLARHIRKHTGERPFQCHCGKAFSRLDNLRQHAQTVHSEDVERNEAMMQELTNLHAHLAASAAQAQHAQALIVANQQGHAAAAAAAAASTPGMSSVPMTKRPSKSGKRGSMSNQGQAARSNGEASPTIANGAGETAAGAQPVNGSSAALPDAHHVASTHETLPSAHLAASPSAAAGSGAPHYHHDAPPMPHYGQPHPQHPGLSYRQPDGPFGEHAPGAPHAHPYGVAPGQHGHPGQWAQRASYPFDPATDAAAHHYHPYSRFATFYGREDEHAPPHHMAQQEAEARHRWEQASMPHAVEAAPADAARAESSTQSLARRDSAAEVSPRSSAALPPPPPPPGPFGLFGETYTGFQSSLSANQVRTSTLAKAHPISPSLPPTSSQGRPLTASDRPILPPLTGSRPGTSQGSLGALLPPLSPTQLPALRPSSSSGAAGVEGAAGVAGTTAAATGWSSRPPTSSGDLGKAFRFQRRSSMLDLPEMSLDSRPASSQGAGHAAALHAGASNGSSGAAMPPPDGAPPSSRGLGLNSSRGSFSMAPSSSHDRLRPLSSSGRLGSAAFASDPFGRRVSLTREHAEDSSRKSPPHSSLVHHSTSSPFRFQPPPLSRDGSSTAAATFFRDRPLTSHLSRIHSSEGRPGGSSALPTLPTSASRRTARFAEGDSADDDRRDTSQQYQRRASSGGYAAATATSEADERRPTTAAASSSLSPTSSPPGPGSSVAALMKRRPLTSGSDAITAGAPRFGASSARQIIQAATARPGSSAGRGAGNGGDIDEGEGKRERGNDEHDEPEERQRPDSSRRVSIASLVGME